MRNNEAQKNYNTAELTPRGSDIVGQATDQNYISLSADIAVASIGWFKVAEVPIGSPE